MSRKINYVLVNMHVSVQTILFKHICSPLYWLDRKSDFYKEKKIALKYLTWYAMTSLKNQQSDGGHATETTLPSW